MSDYKYLRDQLNMAKRL
jgi:ubiquitin-conjugating enzyme E2 D/E